MLVNWSTEFRRSIWIQNYGSIYIGYWYRTANWNSFCMVLSICIWHWHAWVVYMHQVGFSDEYIISASILHTHCSINIILPSQILSRVNAENSPKQQFILCMSHRFIKDLTWCTVSIYVHCTITKLNLSITQAKMDITWQVVYVICIHNFRK